MSAAAVLHRMRTRIRQRGLGPEAIEDIEFALARLDPGFLDLAYALSAFGSRPPSFDPIARAASIGFFVAAVQLADDLADDDLGDWPEGRQRAPGAVMLLQSLATLGLIEGGASASIVADALHRFLRTGSGQQWEVRRGAIWDEASFRRAAEELNGAQFAAYFALLLEGAETPTPADEIGRRFGHVLHVVGDRRSHDRRWAGLGPEDRRAILRWARGELEALAALDWPPLRPHLGRFRAALGG